ncbi:cell division protein ZapA [Thermosipho ferrireducens]|uniref:cell division protein ZapA n=1 Tax=Thermosipho ferrireducens TaxID=2571116 RepID=UPI00389AFB49
MKKTLNIGSKRFIIESDSGEEILNYIEKKVSELKEKYRDISSTDEILLAMLCDIAEEYYIYVERTNKIIKSISDKVSKKIGGNFIEDRSF